MVSRRSFIAFLAGIPFFPTSLLPKKKPIVRTPWDILNEYVPPKEEKHMTEAEFDDFLEKHVNHRPWEVHCFDKRGKEILILENYRENPYLPADFRAALDRRCKRG